MNVDTPEIRPCRCQRKYELGYQAKAFAEQFLVGETLVTRADRKDK